MERTITSLGVDEAVSARGEVSWVSPIAKALLKHRAGDSVKLPTPKGIVEIEVVDVRYEALTPA